MIEMQSKKAAQKHSLWQKKVQASTFPAGKLESNHLQDVMV